MEEHETAESPYGRRFLFRRHPGRWRQHPLRSPCDGRSILVPESDANRIGRFV
jgi:hypothetical protein